MSVLQSSDQESLHFICNIQKHAKNRQLYTIFSHYCNISIYLDLPWNVSTAEFTKWNHKSLQFDSHELPQSTAI